MGQELCWPSCIAAESHRIGREIARERGVIAGLGKAALTMWMLPGRCVAMVDEWIAYVGPDAEYTIGRDTEVIDAGGRILCPGFIDAHTHLTSYFNINDFLSYAIPSGATTLVTEAESYGFALGAEGVKTFLNQIDPCPIKIYTLVPPMISLSPAAKSRMISTQQLAELFEDPRVIGLGEIFWQGAILTRDTRVLDLMGETQKFGKSVQGHAAGAFDKKLAAYAATGVESCHEAISTDDVLNRLEMGLYAMIREGDIRRDLEIILPLKDKVDFRRMILVTDGTNPDLLLKTGYLHDVVQKAVDLRIKKALMDGEGAVRTLDNQSGGLVAREGRGVPMVLSGVGGRHRGLWPPPFAGMPVLSWASAKTMRIWPMPSTM